MVNEIKKKRGRPPNVPKKIDEIIAPLENEEELDVVIEGFPDTIAPPSLLEKVKAQIRLTGGEKKETKKSSTKSVKAHSLVKKVFPTLLAGLVTAWAKDRLMVRLGEVYQGLAPSQDESFAMLEPLFNAISRQIEIKTSASPLSIDIANSLIAAIAYGVRAISTYLEIRQLERIGAITYGQTTEEKETTGINRRGNHTSESERTTRHSSDDTANLTSSSNVHNGHDNDKNSRDYAISLIRKSAKKDSQYRHENGLL